MGQPWGQLVVRDHVIVMGAPGCGKTPFAAALVASARRVVFFDSAGDFGRDPANGEHIPADMLTPDDLRGVVCRVCVQTERGAAGFAGDFLRTVECCKAVASEGGLVLVVDEVGDLKRECEPDLNELHRAGHKHGVATVLCSACATDFPKRCRDTASRVYSFFQKSADDVGTLDREYGEGFGARARAWRHPAPPVSWVSPVLHDTHRSPRC